MSGISNVTGITQVNGGSGGAGINSVGTGFTVTSGVLNSTYPAPRSVAGTTDTITSADAGSEIVYNNASGVAVSIAAATTTGRYRT